MQVAFLSPSELACKAAGLHPAGTALAPVAGRCAMCGTSFAAGDSVVPFQPGVTFTDWASLRAPQSRWICRWCEGVWTRDFTQTHIKSVITQDGVYPAASNDHLAYWILNPPSGPWLFLLGDQKVQHVVWRAPINHSQDLFQVRAGELVLTVRRPIVQRAIASARNLAAVATELRKTRRGAPLKSPFISLSRDIDSMSQGFLRPALIQHAGSDTSCQEDVRVIQSLQPGELWALTAVLYATNPHRPAPKLSALPCSTSLQEA